MRKVLSFVLIVGFLSTLGLDIIVDAWGKHHGQETSVAQNQHCSDTDQSDHQDGSSCFSCHMSHCAFLVTSVIFVGGAESSDRSTTFNFSVPTEPVFNPIRPPIA